MKQTPPPTPASVSKTRPKLAASRAKPTERIDVVALVDDARAHVARDAARALGSVLVAWRATRAPRLAAICQRVGRLVEPRGVPALRAIDGAPVKPAAPTAEAPAASTLVPLEAPITTEAPEK
ncbi:MAG: hypothetical protein H0T89_18270 [Deltaproteobacteria bacterium]|nr:hypothetical protein [Deltaproteobacteria bacterium]